ncbi:transposable element Tcb1 transposase [Trichonephila clavipes]|nr:transposable element Tcb1 transposase [Trichonephila clavipes]
MRPRQRAFPAFPIARHTAGIYVSGPYFSEDKTRPHPARVAMICITACQTLPWPARSPDLSSIEHVWNMMGRRRHQPGNVYDFVQ